MQLSFHLFHAVHELADLFFIIGMTTEDHTLLQVFKGSKESRHIFLSDMADDRDIRRSFFGILPVKPYSDLVHYKQLIGQIRRGIEEHEVIEKQGSRGELADRPVQFFSQNDLHLKKGLD